MTDIRVPKIEAEKITGDPMRRRALLGSAMAGGGAALAFMLRTPMASAAAPAAREQNAMAAGEQMSRGMRSPKIKDISVIPAGSHRLVKVTTDQDGLFGYGEATVGHGLIVEPMVEQFYKELLIGKETSRIDQIWQFCYLATVYKNDHVTNSAISGICDALWDIKGKQLGVPVHELVGGKMRDSAECYVHAGARPLDPKKVVENAGKLIAEVGARNVQIDLFATDAPAKTFDGRPAFDPDELVRKNFAAYAAFRKAFPTIRLGTDVHNILNSTRALQFCKYAEEFRPWYWIEDVVNPEEMGYLRNIRQQTAVPLSMGERWNNPAEWRPLVEERLIDFVRHHTAHIGGFTAARKIAQLCHNYQVGTGWHGTPVSPLGHAANLTVDLTADNFGIREHFGYSPRMREVYQGVVEIKEGYAFINDKPGWGIEVNEALAVKLPGDAGDARVQYLRDGSPVDGS